MPEKQTPKTDPEFNLWDEPWILVLDQNREMREVSLTDVFINAHKYERLAGELPTQDVALLRLLLAVLHTVFSRMNINGDSDPLTEENALDRWEELWDERRISEKPILAYRDEWHDRFWLFHSERPFYQVPEAEIGTEHGAAKLNGILSESGNKLRIFPARQGFEKRRVSYAEAARWLLSVNGFDDTSSKPKGKNLPSPGVGWLGKLGLIYAEGETLFETLLLNLTLLKDGNEIWDSNRPAWELNHARTAERTQIPIPNDPAALLTTQSRRMLLKREGGQVTGFFLLGGDFFERVNAFSEQMTIWRPVMEKNRLVGYQPKRHTSSKQFWREFSTLMATKEGHHRPGIVSWITSLKEQSCIKDQRVIRFSIASVQYGDKDFFVNDIFSDGLNLQLQMFGSMANTLRIQVEDEIQRIEKLAEIVGRLNESLEKAAGGSGEKAREKGKSLLFYQIDTPFRRWLEKLVPDEKTIDAIENWRKQSLQIARSLGQELIDMAGEPAFVGRSYKDKKEREWHYSSPEAINRFDLDLYRLDHPKV